MQAAHAAGRSKNTYLAAQYRRLAERATARNQAILWVFADTGMGISELCGLLECTSSVFLPSDSALQGYLS
jgi:hypothetical protein